MFMVTKATFKSKSRISMLPPDSVSKGSTFQRVEIFHELPACLVCGSEL